MRVLINYATYADRVTIHCLADDARTVVAPLHFQRAIVNDGPVAFLGRLPEDD
jgi:hypothetical protein